VCERDKEREREEERKRQGEKEKERELEAERRERSKRGKEAGRTPNETRRGRSKDSEDKSVREAIARV